jgi:hypothetical protein
MLKSAGTLDSNLITDQGTRHVPEQGSAKGLREIGSTSMFDDCKSQSKLI